MLRRLLHLSLVMLPVFIGCTELVGGAGHISQRIGEAVRDPATTEVDFGKLTSFGWDKVYMFRSGAPRKEVCEFIGADERMCSQSVRNESRAGESMTIAFSLRDSLTHVELHLLENGRFDVAQTEDGIAREKAIFRVRRETGGSKPICWLEQK